MKNRQSNTSSLIRQIQDKLIILAFISALLLPMNSRAAVGFWIKTNSSGLRLEVEHQTVGSYINVSARLLSIPSGNILWQGKPEQDKTVSTLDSYKIKDIAPELWSPVNPRLYNLELKLTTAENTVLDTVVCVGFRDFETKNGQIFLNGNPIFLRGIAINPPGRGIPEEVETSRSFAEDYVRFMKSINVNIIRIPDDETWYDVCDELGMMVFGGNYSGSVNGENPPKNYDQGVDWYKNEKFQPFMHHPSLMIYALTNEVPYKGEIAQRWIDFLSYAHKKLKVWDNTRLYIGNAGYGYGQSGDICDLHRYWGWYYASPFTFLHIRDYEKITFPDKVQPLTFTECVGNYTGPDGSYNLTPNHKNPVSQLNWTGHAPASEQAQLADQHQSFVFKQATELMRRLRRINPESSGVFPFTILFRNWHTVRNFIEMDPKPVTRQTQLSYQPVLLSWENWQSQLYAGARFLPIAHIVNDADDFSDLTDVKLIVRLLDHAYSVHYRDTIPLKDIPYYAIHSENLSLQLPDYLFEGNYRLEGIVLSGDKEVSRNFTPLFVARNEIPASLTARQIFLYDKIGKTCKALEKNGIQIESFESFSKINTGQCIVIGENSADQSLQQSANELLNFVRKGGRLIILKQDSLRQKFLTNVLPVSVDFPQMDVDDPSYPPPARPSRNSFNINPERLEHPVFTGIQREELRVWSDYTNWDETKTGFPAIYPVTNGFILPDKNDIEKTAVLANYSVGLEGIALAEIFNGNGSILLCGFDLANRAGIDPVADRLLQNMVKYMARNSDHKNLLLVDSPILWGDYESERGILTGINSGLMLNSKPALFGSYENLPILLEKEGHMYAGAKWGWNTRAGKQYVPYGRRMFGPYVHRDFGGVPSPIDAEKLGEGVFWCKVPENISTMETIVWNPSEEKLPVFIEINNSEVSSTETLPGTYQVIKTPVPENASQLKVSLRGDRRLVLLQTLFK